MKTKNNSVLNSLNEVLVLTTPGQAE